MINKMRKTFLSAFFVLGIWGGFNVNPALASLDNEDGIIQELMNPQHEQLLKEIAEGIYNRDKGEAYVIEKTCTHSSHVVDAWKAFGTKPGGIKSNYWRSMKQRGSLVVFKDNQYESFIKNNINNPFNIHISRQQGDARKTISLKVILNSANVIGEKYIDMQHGEVTGRKSAGSDYQVTDLHLVKISFDISDIIQKIKNERNIGVYDNYRGMGSILTICPTD